MQNIFTAIRGRAVAGQSIFAAAGAPLLWATAGFVCSFFTMGNGCSPFAAALPSVATLPCGCAAAIGALAAGLVRLPGSSARV